ncbi:MAG TPA: hypothetical protein ENI04_00755 [Candidatus Wildermuthbacteria bacterium]|nr:hypothetical protein [Candidatus Wildermuthbacteria bacterium]
MKSKEYFFAIIFLVFLFIPLISASAAPTLIYPTEDDSPIWKGEIEFEWTNSETSLSQYHINLPDGTAKDDVTSYLSFSSYDLAVGEYTWAVRSCQDEEGLNCGDWSGDQAFEIIFAPTGTSGGLVACGKKYDNRDTAINESEPCGIPHLFLLLKNVLDFVLWKLGLLIIALMAVLTAITSFFSFGSTDIIIRIKAMWKSILIGYLVMLLAWLAVNVALNFLGFKFGEWWIISF